jgi:uncharacterized Zn-finger protein
LIENESRLKVELSKQTEFVKVEVFASPLIIYEEQSNSENCQEKEKPNRKKPPQKTKNVEKGHLKEMYDNLPTDAQGKVICPQCNKLFLRIYIHQHIERVHLAVKSYTCDKCGHNFYKRSSIESHMNQHSNIKPFKCPKKNCDKRFCSKKSMKTHVIKLHTEGSSLYYICEICAQNFKEKHLLKVKFLK